jgi:tellurite resistance protein
MAPPAAGYIAYTELNGGELDHFARFLFHTGVFFALLLFTMARQFLRLPFSIGWWAYGFPAAAMGGASLRYHAVIDSGPSLAIAYVLTVSASALIIAVLVRSVIALARGQFFSPA